MTEHIVVVFFISVYKFVAFVLLCGYNIYRKTSFHLYYAHTHIATVGSRSLTKWDLCKSEYPFVHICKRKKQKTTLSERTKCNRVIRVFSPFFPFLFSDQKKKNVNVLFI